MCKLAQAAISCLGTHFTVPTNTHQGVEPPRAPFTMRGWGVGRAWRVKERALVERAVRCTLRESKAKTPEFPLVILGTR